MFQCRIQLSATRYVLDIIGKTHLVNCNAALYNHYTPQESTMKHDLYSSMVLISRFIVPSTLTSLAWTNLNEVHSSLRMKPDL